MVTIFMTAIASGLVLAAYAYQRGQAVDPERMAGRVWADVSHQRFAECPRDNGIGFWLGCTDRAPAGRDRP